MRNMLSHLLDRAVFRLWWPYSPLVEVVQGDEESRAQGCHGGGQGNGDVPEENHMWSAPIGDWSRRGGDPERRRWRCRWRGWVTALLDADSVETECRFPLLAVQAGRLSTCDRALSACFCFETRKRGKMLRSSAARKFHHFCTFGQNRNY